MLSLNITAQDTEQCITVSAGFRAGGPVSGRPTAGVSRGYRTAGVRAGYQPSSCRSESVGKTVPDQLMHCYKVTIFIFPLACRSQIAVTLQPPARRSLALIG